MSLVSRLSAGTLLLTLSSLALSACPASADVVFSNLPFATNSGTGITGPTSSAGFYTEAAVQFTPLSTFTLNTIQIPFYHLNGSNNAITVTLYTSVSNLPGVSLGTQTLPANTLTSPPASLYTFNFGNSTLLTAGTSYFVGAATTGNAYQVWNSTLNSSAIPSVIRNQPTGSFSAFAPRSFALQVNGTPFAAVTPEPGNVALLIGLATTGAGFLSRRRRQQARNAA